MPNRGNMLIVMLVVATATTGTCWATSFDCAKAKTKTEKLICADPALSKADDVMAAAYRKALEVASQLAPDDVKQLKADQRAWLTERVSDCEEGKCIDTEYQGRSRVLSYYAEHLTGSSSILTGTYEMLQSESTNVVSDSGKKYVQKSSSFGSLSVGQLPNGFIHLDLDVNQVFDAAKGDVRTGGVTGQVAVEQGVAIYTDPNQADCKLTMTFSKTKAIVAQSGNCGFGLNVSVDGVYMKTGDTPEPDSPR
jgi:uncharacterized protein